MRVAIGVLVFVLLLVAGCGGNALGDGAVVEVTRSADNIGPAGSGAASNAYVRVPAGSRSVTFWRHGATTDAPAVVLRFLSGDGDYTVIYNVELQAGELLAAPITLSDDVSTVGVANFDASPISTARLVFEIE